jgi:glycosyltransferase involved in cell wall biosynthesis
MKALVSILIPAYNAEKWIADTIKSALGQTWSNKEIVIVDDGSRDRTFSIAKQFASRRIRVVGQENQGASVARNKAMNLCQGDYIQWLDADDLLCPDKIAKQMQAAEKLGNNRTLFSSGWGYFLYRPFKAKFTSSSLWCDLSPVEWLVRKWENNVHMQTATWLVSRELTKAAGPWDARLLNNDDGEYFCRVIAASNGIQFVPGAKVFYRQAGSDRLSYVGTSSRKIDAHFLGMQLQISTLRSLEDSDRVRAACLQHLQTCFFYFYPERPDLVEQMRQLAADVGGELQLPRLSWKYVWIEKLLGFAAAKHTQLYYNQGKSYALRAWDELIHWFESRRKGPECESVATEKFNNQNPGYVRCYPSHSIGKTSRKAS